MSNEVGLGAIGVCAGKEQGADAGQLEQQRPLHSNAGQGHQGDSRLGVVSGGFGGGDHGGWREGGEDFWSRVLQRENELRMSEEIQVGREGSVVKWNLDLLSIRERKTESMNAFLVLLFSLSE